MDLIELAHFAYRHASVLMLIFAFPAWAGLLWVGMRWLEPRYSYLVGTWMWLSGQLLYVPWTAFLIWYEYRFPGYIPIDPDPIVNALNDWRNGLRLAGITEVALLALLVWIVRSDWSDWKRHKEWTMGFAADGLHMAGVWAELADAYRARGLDAQAEELEQEAEEMYRDAVGRFEEVGYKRGLWPPNFWEYLRAGEP